RDRGPQPQGPGGTRHRPGPGVLGAGPAGGPAGPGVGAALGGGSGPGGGGPRTVPPGRLVGSAGDAGPWSWNESPRPPRSANVATKPGGVARPSGWSRRWELCTT